MYIYMHAQHTPKIVFYLLRPHIWSLNPRHKDKSSKLELPSLFLGSGFMVGLVVCTVI